MADLLEHFEAAIRPPRPGSDEKTCPCCKGKGEHGGGECDPCGGSGSLPKDEPPSYCPGQRQPRRKHWRQGSVAAASSEYSAGRMRVSDLRRPGEGRLSEREYTQRELAADIRRNGVQQPLAVEHFPVHGGPTVFNGLHRLDAAERAQVHDVPVVVRHRPGDPPPMTGRRPATEQEFGDVYNLERSGRWWGGKEAMIRQRREAMACVGDYGMSHRPKPRMLHDAAMPSWQHPGMKPEWDHEAYEREGSAYMDRARGQRDR